MTPLRLTHATALVIRALAAGHRHGFEIMEVSGLASGTVYPALRRLEREGMVSSTWEGRALAREAGRPRRRMYRLTAKGDAMAAAAAERLADAGRFLSGEGLRPAEGEGRG